MGSICFGLFLPILPLIIFWRSTFSPDYTCSVEYFNNPNEASVQGFVQLFPLGIRCDHVNFDGSQFSTGPSWLLTIILLASIGLIAFGVVGFVKLIRR